VSSSDQAPARKGAAALQRAFVVCLGNELRADDGVGIHVGRRLEARGLPPGVNLLYAPSAGLDLLEPLVDAQLVVLVDALQMGAAPGSCHVLEPSDWLPAQGRPTSWCHGASLDQVLAAARALRPKGDLPRVLVVGVEAQEMQRYDTELTAPVAAALEQAADAVLALIARS